MWHGFTPWDIQGYNERHRAGLAREREESLKTMPFRVKSLEPVCLDGYQLGKPSHEQPATVPLTFIEAMQVREKVFVEEQGLPLVNQFDNHDPYSVHFVTYRYLWKIVQEEVKDADGNVVTPEKWETRRTPIGCIRIEPFPHDPHPTKNARYWGGITQQEHKGKYVWKPEKTSINYFVDRKTSFHDGREPYLKIGRLAVLKEYRNTGTAKLLFNCAIDWMCKNPNRFDPSVRTKGLGRLCAVNGVCPSWLGLVCVHTPEKVIPVWKTFGFEVDEQMGTWYDEGVKHAGMWRRVDFGKKPILLKRDAGYITQNIDPDGHRVW